MFIPTGSLELGLERLCRLYIRLVLLFVGLQLTKNTKGNKLNELHLFAGAGGGILGGMLLGHTTVCAVEIEEYPRRVLLQRQRDGILPRFPIWDDVQTFDGRPWRGKVDILCGGFPCQDISSAGRGAGIGGSKSSMWGHMARITDEIRPRYVFAENSPNLVSRGLGQVICDLSSMGYDVRWGIMGAKTANLPHQRKRIWLVADTKGFDGRNKPEDTSNGLAWRCREELAEGSENDWVDVATEFCGMDDGVADRLDRLFAIGNGQVPAVAASAFHFLANAE